MKEQEIWLDFDFANYGVQKQHVFHESNALRLARV
jgi:hypothetical protein